jgi:hypothetical protein
VRSCWAYTENGMSTSKAVTTHGETPSDLSQELVANARSVSQPFSLIALYLNFSILVRDVERDACRSSAGYVAGIATKLTYGLGLVAR